MEKYSPQLKDLAPRDIVTRAIVEEMTESKDDFVYLDLAGSYNGDEPIRERFPNIFRECQSIGIDIERDPIPVVPAAHYFCGGVLTNNVGESTLARLYAVGETSCSGVHGANRLASTSLLEGLTWGFHAAASIARKLKETMAEPESRDSDSPDGAKVSGNAPSIRRALSSREPAMGGLDTRIFGTIPDWREAGHENLEDPALILQDWTTIQHTMWNYVGIVRTSERLDRAVADMRELGARLTKFYHESRISKEIIELFHGQYTASLIANAAMKNPVSLGTHFRRD